jgi:nucleoside-specific outer membrane channel protein Tsx
MEKSKSEARIQQEIVLWFNNEYPNFRGLLCYNNNNSTGGYRGKVNKFLGIIKGRSDMVLYYSGKGYMIELKDDRGRQSKDQIEWQLLIESQGFTYFIIRSKEEAEILINRIIKND